nr:HlyD family secretion protein [uncultured Lichenicoccus sp.]
MADDDPDGEQDDRGQEQDRKPKAYRGRVSFAFFLAGLIGLVVLLAWGVGWDQVFADRSNPETEDAYADGTERPLAARISGYVEQMLVTDNQQVAAHQVLMVIEDDEYLAAVARDEAMVAADRAAIAAMQASREAAVSTVAQSGNLAGGNASRADFAAEEAARQHRILGSDLGLLARYQMSEASLGVARAQTARSRSRTDVSRAQVAMLDAELAQANAQLAQDAAVLATARLDLGYTRITAPQVGVLGVRQVHVGDLVSPGRDVVSLTPLDDVWVTAYFSERQLDHVRPGQPARLRLDAFPDVTLAGHVVAIGPLTAQQFSDVPADNITGNYTKVVQRVPVKLSIDPGGPLAGQVRPGMSALVRIDTSGPAQVRTAR